MSRATSATSMPAAAGRTFYAIAILAFGLLHIAYGDFVTRVVPWWPAAIPGRWMWAEIIGALLIAAGAAILLNRGTAAAATLLASGLLLSFLLLGVPLVAKDSVFGGAWTVAGKALALCGGAWLIAQASPASKTARAPLSRLMQMQMSLPLGTWFLAAFLILCGIQHFIYIDFVISLIPTWIPAARFWGYFAGIALIAGGLGLIVPATTRLAGLLTGAMIFSWVFLVHIPRAARTFPQTTNETTAVFEALAMTGIAWLAARSQRFP